MSDNLEVLRAILAAEERDTLAIANANAAALRWAIAHLAALPSAADEPNVWEPTPMVPGRFGGEEVAFRMDAYYYGFGATGIKAIDLILSAVACAGKAYHLTEQWTEECEAYHEGLRGECPIDWIANAAHDAAEVMRKALRPASARPSAGVGEVVGEIARNVFGDPFVKCAEGVALADIIGAKVYRSRPAEVAAGDAWQSLDSAPRDGRPVWVRGWDWGKVDGKRHFTWAYWDGGWYEASSSEASQLGYLDSWLAAAQPGAK